MREDARADGHTDMGKLTVAFSNFVNTTALYSLYVVQVMSPCLFSESRLKYTCTVWQNTVS